MPRTRPTALIAAVLALAAALLVAAPSPAAAGGYTPVGSCQAGTAGPVASGRFMLTTSGKYVFALRGYFGKAPGPDLMTPTTRTNITVRRLHKDNTSATLGTYRDLRGLTYLSPTVRATYRDDSRLIAHATFVRSWPFPDKRCSFWLKTRDGSN